MEIAESQLSLDMRELKRTRLSMHHPQGFTAYRNGKEVGSYRVELVSLRKILEVLQWDVIVVRYTHGGSERMAERVEIDSTPCNYGGWRYWFRCPGCGRRCLVLYIKHHVRCRICHGLIFESQSQHEDERQVSQIANRRQKLGGSRDLSREFPPKPKGMHWKTYFQLERRDAHEVDQKSREMNAWLDALGFRFLAHQAKKGRTGETETSAPDYNDLARSEREVMEWLVANADLSDRIVRELAANAQTQQFPRFEKSRKTK